MKYISLPEPSTPDYNHDCVTLYLIAPYTIFYNGLWVENPRTGIAMAGFATYASPNMYHIPMEVREYIGMTLSQPLQKDSMYYVSLYVSKADSVSYATDINVYFAWNIPILDHYGAIDSVPQISSDNVITNHIGWTKIEGSFIAKGGERYLIIGNQYKDDKIKIQYINPFPTANGDTLYRAFSYYNVDDVCISTKASECGVSVSNIETVFTNYMTLYQLYPNPASERVFLRGKENELCMLTWYNNTGEKVKQGEVQSGQSVDVSDLPKGTYIVQIQGKKGFTTQKMLIY
jgi:hypothetical protein